MIYSTAFLIGFLGSLHCIGMCGPIAMALPVPQQSRWLGGMLYNIGRMFTYAILGLILGVVGFSIQLAGLQKSFSVLIGLSMLIIITFPTIFRKIEGSYYQTSLVRFVKNKIGQMFKTKTMSAAFLIGALNGLLPCGLVYAAIAGSLMLASTFEAAIYMLTFALGTMPIMLIAFLVPFQGRRIPALRKVVPSFLFFLAILFIYRGIAIELPMIDPILDSVGIGKITQCGSTP